VSFVKVTALVCACRDMPARKRQSTRKRFYLERDAKFDEIVSRLQRELHPDTSSLTKMDWKQLTEDAEELTDNWATAEADSSLPGVTTIRDRDWRRIDHSPMF
jgi:hypothetical protein